MLGIVLSILKKLEKQKGIIRAERGAEDHRNGVIKNAGGHGGRGVDDEYAGTVEDRVEKKSFLSNMVEPTIMMI